MSECVQEICQAGACLMMAHGAQPPSELMLLHAVWDCGCCLEECVCEGHFRIQNRTPNWASLDAISH